MLEDTGFVHVQIGEGVDTFGGATGEDKARAFEVYGYAFLTHKPDRDTEPPDERRHAACVVSDELDWSGSANYAEPAG